jgi:chromosome segregation ATPase
MSSTLEKLRCEIVGRIIDLEYSDEQHKNEVVDLEIKVKKINEKREKVTEYIGIAKRELAELDQFIEWKKDNEGN